MILIENPNSKPKFKPSLNTCYRPDLYNKDECDKCEFRNYALCKNSPNYKNEKEIVSRDILLKIERRINMHIKIKYFNKQLEKIQK